jgi:hypothetical protein
MDSGSGRLEDGFLHELGSELVSMISELLKDEVSVPSLSMRDLQHYGTLLVHDDLIDPHIIYLTTYSHSLSNSSSNEYKLDGIWTTLLFG